MHRFVSRHRATTVSGATEAPVADSGSLKRQRTRSGGLSSPVRCSKNPQKVISADSHSQPRMSQEEIIARRNPWGFTAPFVSALTPIQRNVSKRFRSNDADVSTVSKALLVFSDHMPQRNVGTAS